MPAELDGETVRTIEIGNLLGCSEDYFAVQSGTYIPFPDGKSLLQMIQDPIKWVKWYNENTKA